MCHIYIKVYQPSSSRVVGFDKAYRWLFVGKLVGIGQHQHRQQQCIGTSCEKAVFIRSFFIQDRNEADMRCYDGVCDAKLCQSRNGKERKLMVRSFSFWPHGNIGSIFHIRSFVPSTEGDAREYFRARPRLSSTITHCKCKHSPVGEQLFIKTIKLVPVNGMHSLAAVVREIHFSLATTKKLFIR